VFRFTIRDVLLLTVVVGLALGWWVDHSRLAAIVKAQRPLANIAIDLMGACKKVGWTVELHHGEVVVVDLPGVTRPGVAVYPPALATPNDQRAQ
jgi:hypothetical protein